jgi:hypothetical protein
MTEGKSIVPFGGRDISQLPEVQNILGDSSLDRLAKARKVQELGGLRQPRQKYPTPEARHDAQRARSKEHRELRNAPLYEVGLMHKRGPKLTPEQRLEHKLARRERRKEERKSLKLMAIKNPELAQEFGIDPSRIRLKTLGPKLAPKTKGKKAKSKNGPVTTIKPLGKKKK